MNTVYKLTIAREPASDYVNMPTGSANSPRIVYNMFKDLAATWDREHCLVVCLDSKNHITGYHTVSVGSLAASIIHPREVFKVAILANAASIILVHNHPSGGTVPSEDDRKLTERITEAGIIIGIPMLDHVIIGNNSYYSFKSGESEDD